MRLLGYIFVFILGTSYCYSQDVHWSQYDHNPVFVNPSNVGRFNGSYRFYLNYRTQWKSVTVPFSTISISAEAKNIYKNLSVGGYIMHDVEGDGKMRTVEIQPMASYTFKLSYDSTNLIRPAIGFGLNIRSLNASAFTFDSQWNGQQFDKSLPTNENFHSQTKTNFTMGAGVSFEHQEGKRHRFVVGIGLFNITRPDQGFFGDKIKRKMRFSAFAQAEYQVGFDWDILPSVRFNTQGKYKEITFGGQVRYILKDKLGLHRAILGGIYYRAKDAPYISLGMEYQNWWVGLSYDINTSSLTPASHGRGGFELSIRYLFTHFSPRGIKHRVCPDFI